ncbi:MAG: DNA polymerase III subunit alpha [bacterium]
MYLNCHSYYSLRYGTLSLEKLAEQAATYGVSAMALTDINNSTGIMDFVAACKEKGVKPIAGIEFRRKDRLLYVGLAKNNEGFRELNEFLSHHTLRNIPLPDRPPEFENVVVVRPFTSPPSPPLLKERGLGGEVVGIRPSDMNPIILSRHRHLIPRMVIMAPVTLADEPTWELHRNLRAIDHNILLTRLEPHHLASSEEVMKPLDELLDPFREYPEIIRNTEKLMDACSIDFDFRECKNKRTFTGSIYDDQILLEKLALDGLEYRYGREHVEARNRIRHEVDIICKMGFAAYFLIAWDIIRYSMARGFYHVGRGSGANSIVAYCLKITNVDPIELDLYFERFINPKRTSPPDFDIDYSWKERDEVLDYIFKRYGHEHTALLGAMSTFRGNSIYRELGKVHGLPKGEMDAFLKHPEESINRSSIIEKISKIGEMMVDFPNIRSIHAGGVLISEKPITCYTALDLPPKGFPTTQWDMYVAEDIGFEKLDILSQRGIGHIFETVGIVKKSRNISVDVHNVKQFKQDPEVKKLLQSACTIGCFYVESPAMRGLLKKLRCDDYRTLVAASSIIRPGVARSGMMKEYIYRFHNPGKFKYLHPIMEAQLKETYGVMIYQEDVLKICHHFAGLDLSESDVIRRAMSGKYRSKKELQRIIDKFFSNCKESGYPEEVTKEVWRQIESFAGYSFSKAHSASYAVESYQSLYLKAHFPLEFMVGVINNFGGFYPSWVYMNEAKNWGAQMHLPCVNNGDYKTCLRGEKDIYVGFIHIANLEYHLGKAISEERAANGDFQDLEDFVARVPITIEQLVILIRVGAFRFTGKPKATLLWEAHMLLGKSQLAVGSCQSTVHSPQSPVASHQSPVTDHRSANPIVNCQLSIVNSVPTKRFELPALWQSQLEEVYDEIELLGWPVTHTWFDLLETSFRGEIMATEMNQFIGKKVRMLGLLVTIKYVRTVKKEWMHFGTFIDVHGQFFDTVHFPQVVNKYPFRGDGIYLVLGKIVEEFGFPSLEVEKMAKMPVKADPRI